MKNDFWSGLMLLQKQYGKMLEPVCKEWNMTRNEMDVLLFLANNPEYDRASQIVERRGIAKSHVSLAVTELEKKGFLGKCSDARDHRTTRLYLTELGTQAARAGQKAQQTFFAALRQDVPEPQMETVSSVLRQVLKNVSKMEEK